MANSEIVKINLADAIEAIGDRHAEPKIRHINICVSETELSRWIETTDAVKANACGDIIKPSSLAREILMLAADQVLKLRAAKANSHATNAI